MNKLTSTLLVLLCSSFAPALAQIEIGSEVQANSFTTGNQNVPHAAIGPQQDFMVVWSSDGQDGDSFGVFAQRFDPEGATLGAEFRINQTLAEFQSLATIDFDLSGRFVVAWHSYLQDGSGVAVQARLFDSSGAALTNEFDVNTYTTSNQSSPEVGFDSSGRFVVIWDSWAQDGSQWGVFGQAFDSLGVASGPEFMVNTYTTDQQDFPDLAVAPSGEFVVVWGGGTQGADYDVFARRFDSLANPAGPPFSIASGAAVQHRPRVAIHADSSFVVAWESDGQDGDGLGVFARAFDSSGAPTSGQVAVNQWTTGAQNNISLATEGDRGFVVAWESDSGDSEGAASFRRHFNRLGQASSDEIQLPTSGSGDQRWPFLAADGRRLLTAWTDNSLLPASDQEVRVRFWDTETIFIDGFESGDPNTWTSVSP